MAAEAWNSFQNKTHFVTAEATRVRQEQELGDTSQTSKRNRKQKKIRKRFKTFKREIFKMQMKNSEEAFTRILSEINKYAAQFQLRLSHRTTQSIVGSDSIGSCFWLIPVMTRVI